MDIKSKSGIIICAIKEAPNKDGSRIFKNVEIEDEIIKQVYLPRELAPYFEANFGKQTKLFFEPYSHQINIVAIKQEDGRIYSMLPKHKMPTKVLATITLPLFIGFALWYTIIIGAKNTKKLEEVLAKEKGRIINLCQ